VLLVHPSDEFIGSLPHGRVPDRHDFERFEHASRVRYWRDVVTRCQVLADELAEALNGALAARVEPL